MTTKYFTRDEVAQHNTKEDCYTIVHEKVYDVTHYMDKHPGGFDLMFRNAGKDSTSDFEAMFHSQKARALLDDYYVGELNNRNSITSGSHNNLTRFAQQNHLSVYNSRNGASGNSNAQYPFLKSSNDQRLKKLQEMQKSWAVPPSKTPAPTSTDVNGSSISSNDSGAKIRQETNSNSESPMSSISFKRYKLVNKLNISDDSSIFKFKLHSRSSVLCIPPGKHIQVCVVQEDEITGKPNRIVRKYTPVRSDQAGYFELLIKKYENGVVSKHIFNMEIGDRLLMRGPFGIYEYSSLPNNNIVMMAMGTGITPMYQIIQHVVNNEQDTTKMYLLYGCRAEKDILLHSELNLLSERYPNKLKVHYFISKPTTDMTGEGVAQMHHGRINSEALKHIAQDIPMKDAGQILLCGTDDFCQEIKNICREEYGVTTDKIHIF